MTARDARAVPVVTHRPPKAPPPRVVASPRMTALGDAVRRDGDRAAAAFWDEVAERGTPLVEPGDGPDARIATFLWRDRHGAAPGTRAVLLMANKLTDPSVWEASTLERLPGTDVWHRSYLLPADWRATYQLAADDGPEPPAEGEGPPGPGRRWRGMAALAAADPLNSRRFPGRAGGAPLSVAELPDAPALPRPVPAGAPRGTVTRGRLPPAALGAPRDAWLYVPAGVPAGPMPLAVVFDGEDWCGRLDLPAILDGLIAEGAVPPLVAVLPDSVDVATRWRDLTCDAAFERFVVDELIPWAAARAWVTGDPDRTIVAGQSLGGLTALHLLLSGGRFGAAVVQSASLWWSPDGDATDGGWLGALAASAAPATVHLEVGSEEWALIDQHRRLRDALRSAGHRVTYGEYSGGHDAICWRSAMAEGLERVAGTWGPAARG
ncbi:MAG: enterochelin esterase [Thermoleophilia bacterium]